MRVLFVTDLHGNKWKYERLLEAAKEFRADVVINGGDMLPWNNDPFRQGEFITNYLDDHFAWFNSAGIYYLCYPGNDDLRIFDKLFEETSDKYPFVISLAQRKFEFGSCEFIGMNWVNDYPFRLKDRCRMDTDKYVLGTQFGKGLLSTPEGWQEIDDWFAYVKTPNHWGRAQSTGMPQGYVKECVHNPHTPIRNRIGSMFSSCSEGWIKGGL